MSDLIQDNKWCILDQFALMLLDITTKILDISIPCIPREDRKVWSSSSSRDNIDGASLGSPGLASSASICRDPVGLFLSAFAQYIGVANAFRAELMAAILAIKLVVLRGGSSLWLESDSTLVISALNRFDIVP